MPTTLEDQVTPKLPGFGTPEGTPSQFEPAPFVTLIIPGRLPSWNAILAMEHWARDRYKTTLRENFLSALQLSARDCSTRTTYAKSTLSTAAATLASYDRMIRARRKLRSDKRRSEKASLSLSKSKSSGKGVPF
jgi:hypothetical protein